MGSVNALFSGMAFATLIYTIHLACIIHEDSAPRVNSAKQVTLSPEKRGSPRAEGDRVRCDAILALASNRQPVIAGLTINSPQ